MRRFSPTRGFTLLELLVAVTITLVLSGIMLAVTINTLNLWRRTQNKFTASSQAKLALDLIERDLQTACYRTDGLGTTWLAVDVINLSGTLISHGWQSAATMKPSTAESQHLLPISVNGLEPAIADARFGLSGIWLRFIATNVESGGSLPTAISYQIARRPLSGSNTTSTNPADIRYTLFRAAVANDKTILSGNSVVSAAYGSASSTPTSSRSSSTLTNPNLSDALATNVVDFGVWLYVRDAGTGNLRRIYPATNGDLTHGAIDQAGAADANRFPDVADVMMRVLTDEGARQLDAMESPSSPLLPPAGLSPAEWWWSVVEANSTVFVRRVEIKGGAL